MSLSANVLILSALINLKKTSRDMSKDEQILLFYDMASEGLSFFDMQLAMYNKKSYNADMWYRGK